MPALNVRGVPQEIHALLVEEARRSHRSLSAVVLDALGDYAQRIRKRERMARLRHEMDALRATIRRRRGTTKESATLLAEDRRR